MNAPKVDVLAVMDARILKAFARDTGPFRVNKDSATELAAALAAVIEARAAVAELIEADKEYDEAYNGLSDNKAGPLTQRTRRMDAAEKRRAAALARVGGAA